MDTEIAYSHLPITSNKVGSWRFVEPFLEKKNPPCSQGCPLNQNIREACSFLEKDDVLQAFFAMAKKNPLLYTTGTVCPHFCQQECNRNQVDSSLLIGNIEAFLGENQIDKSLSSLKVSSFFQKKIAIIGAGPSGLSAAYQAARYGASVQIFEQEALAGGMVQYGIPDLRLHKNLLQKEINRIFTSFPQISLKLNQFITPSDIQNMALEFDYVILALGNQKGISSDIPHVWQGIESLKKRHQGLYQFPKQGHYLVLGGGNTAMDVAYYLLNQKNQVTILVRREKSQMRAFEEEIKRVEALGGQIKGLSTLQSYSPTAQEARIKENQQDSIIKVHGVYACFGQKPSEEFLNQDYPSNVFFIGDFSGAEATVTHAVSSGANLIYSLLEKEQIIKKPVFTNLKKSDFNKDFWKDKKQDSFSSPLQEASRCMQCGTCTACGICETFCPDFAITTKEEAHFDLDYCKGCEICSQECPRNAITIKEADI